MPPGLRLFLLLAPLIPAAGAGADIASGEALYAPCIACHGANGEGNADLASPAIAGQSEDYLVRQLKNFKRGIRGASPDDQSGALMRSMAATLADDAAIADVAAFVASLDAPVPEATLSGDVENGAKLYVSRCGACHAGKGEGNDALYAPRLVGLRDSYIVRQVRSFRTGTRGAHADDRYGRQMAIMAKVVTDKELNDIVAFLNELAKQ